MSTVLYAVNLLRKVPGISYQDLLVDLMLQLEQQQIYDYKQIFTLQPRQCNLIIRNLMNKYKYSQFGGNGDSDDSDDDFAKASTFGRLIESMEEAIKVSTEETIDTNPSKNIHKSLLNMHDRASTFKGAPLSKPPPTSKGAPSSNHPPTSKGAPLSKPPPTKSNLINDLNTDLQSIAEKDRKRQETPVLIIPNAALEFQIMKNNLKPTPTSEKLSNYTGSPKQNPLYKIYPDNKNTRIIYTPYLLDIDTNITDFNGFSKLFLQNINKIDLDTFPQIAIDIILSLFIEFYSDIINRTLIFINTLDQNTSDITLLLKEQMYNMINKDYIFGLYIDNPFALNNSYKSLIMYITNVTIKYGYFNKDIYYLFYKLNYKLFINKINKKKLTIGQKFEYNDFKDTEFYSEIKQNTQQPPSNHFLVFDTSTIKSLQNLNEFIIHPETSLFAIYAQQSNRNTYIININLSGQRLINYINENFECPNDIYILKNNTIYINSKDIYKDSTFVNQPKITHLLIHVKTLFSHINAYILYLNDLIM